MLSIFYTELGKCKTLREPRVMASMKEEGMMYARNSLTCTKGKVANYRLFIFCMSAIDGAIVYPELVSDNFTG